MYCSHCQSMTIYIVDMVSLPSVISELIFHPTLTLCVTVSTINLAHYHRYLSLTTPIMLDEISFWMINCNLCLSNETMILQCYAIWSGFFSESVIISHNSKWWYKHCWNNLISFSISIMFVITGHTQTLMCFKCAHDSILLTPKNGIVFLFFSYIPKL